MDRSFWLDRWASNNIGFHESEVNPALTAHLDRLALVPGGRVFVPLCGKTLDIPWLLSRGYRVAGAELSELAIKALFDGLELSAEVMPLGPLTRYSADGIDIFVGDIFDLTPDLLGPVEAIYDRAALVALPAQARERYARHLAGISDGAAQLLVSFEYDQAQMAGPPFAVDAAEIHRLYTPAYRPELLLREPVPGGLKGLCEAQACTWLLAPGDASC